MRTCTPGVKGFQNLWELWEPVGAQRVSPDPFPGAEAEGPASPSCSLAPPPPHGCRPCAREETLLGCSFLLCKVEIVEPTLCSRCAEGPKACS